MILIDVLCTKLCCSSKQGSSRQIMANHAVESVDEYTLAPPDQVIHTIASTTFAPLAAIPSAIQFAKFDK